MLDADNNASRLRRLPRQAPFLRAAGLPVYICLEFAEKARHFQHGLGSGGCTHRRRGHRLLLTAGSIILPAEADLAVVCGYEAVVGDDAPMGVPPGESRVTSTTGDRQDCSH